MFLNKGTRQVWRFINDGSASIYHELRKFHDERINAVFVAHNGVSFDGPIIGRFCGFQYPYHRLCDSLVLSYLYNPALVGGHSLEAYGEKLNYPKVAHTDWSVYTPAMLHRCEQDVYLLEKVHDALLQRMNKIGFSELSCQIEHKIRRIIDKQQENGFWFNKPEAEKLHKFLREKEAELQAPVLKLFPPVLTPTKTYERKTKQDGGEFASYLRHLEESDAVQDNEDGTYTTLNYKPFNLGSPQQRLERLLSLGYEPTEKTKKGNPRIDEDSLMAYSLECGRPEIKAMAEWLVHNGRANMVETWLGYVTKDSRIHGRVFSCGATSRRMRHSEPNLANIPSAQNGARYGNECRSLFGVTPGLGRVLMGYDAKGLETAVLLHHIAAAAPRVFKQAVELLLHGDVHQLNADDLTKELGFPVVRGGGGAKTILYSTVFGAYPPKLGSIVKKGPKEGEIIKKVIYRNVPGLKAVTEWAIDDWKQGDKRIRTIDGGYVLCPSEHAALNYHIQPDGGVYMKYTSILFDERTKKQGLWHLKVVDVHDESQHEIKAQDAEVMSKLAIQCMEDAGEELGFKVKMTGTAKIGKDWSCTH